MQKHLINLPKDSNAAFNQLSNSDKSLSPGAGVIFIYQTQHDSEYYVLGYWRNNPVLSSSSLQLGLAIGGKIENPEESLVKELQTNIALKTLGHLNMDYHNIQSHFACLFIHHQWNLRYLTCIQEITVENLTHLQEIVKTIKNTHVKYGIYKLRDIIKACSLSAIQDEDKKVPMPMIEYSTNEIQNVVVFDDIATNFIFQNQFNYFSQLPDPLKSKTLSYLSQQDLANATVTNKEMAFFTKPEKIYWNKLINNHDMNINELKHPDFKLDIQKFKEKYQLTNEQIYMVVSLLENKSAELKKLICENSQLIFAVMIILFDDLHKQSISSRPLNQTKFVHHFLTFGDLLSRSIDNDIIRTKLINEPLFHFIFSNFYTLGNAQWLISNNFLSKVKNFIYHLASNSPVILKTRFKNIDSISYFILEEGLNNELVLNLKQLTLSDRDYFKTLISSENDLMKIQELFTDIAQDLTVVYKTLYSDLNFNPLG